MSEEIGSDGLESLGELLFGGGWGDRVGVVIAGEGGGCGVG